MGLNNTINGLLGNITSKAQSFLGSPLGAATAGAIVGGVSVGAVTAGVSAIKKRRAKRSRKKTTRRKSRRSRSRKTPRTAGKRKDTSSRRIRQTKNGQPYVILANGRARFISKKSARMSRRRKGGRY